MFGCEGYLLAFVFVFAFARPRPSGIYIHIHIHILSPVVFGSDVLHMIDFDVHFRPVVILPPNLVDGCDYLPDFRLLSWSPLPTALLPLAPIKRPVMHLGLCGIISRWLSIFVILLKASRC